MQPLLLPPREPVPGGSGWGKPSTLPCPAVLRPHRLCSGRARPAQPPSPTFSLYLCSSFYFPSSLDLGSPRLSSCLFFTFSETHSLFCFSFSSVSSPSPGTSSLSLPIFVHLSICLLLSVFLSLLISLPHHLGLTPALVRLRVSPCLPVSPALLSPCPVSPNTHPVLDRPRGHSAPRLAGPAGGIS